MEPSLQGLITLEVTKLTAVGAQPWVCHSGKEGERESNLKKDKAVTSLNLFSLLVSCLLLFYFCKGEGLETIHTSCMSQISENALQTKLLRFMFSLPTYKDVSFSSLLFSASFHMPPLLLFIDTLIIGMKLFFSFR